jgi:superfamily II DNA or RNA helicase
MSSRKRVCSGDESPAKRTVLDQDWKIYEEQVVAEHRRRWPCMRVYPWYAVPDDVLVACGWLNDFTAHMQCKAADGKLAYYREFGLDAVAVPIEAVLVPAADVAMVPAADVTIHLMQAKHRRSVGPDDLGAFGTAVRLCAATLAQRGNSVPLSAVLYYSQCLTPGGWLSMQQLLPVVVSVDAVSLPFDRQTMCILRDAVDDTVADCGMCPEPSRLPTDSSHTLRPYQHDAVAALDAWSSGIGVLDMPCGTGKTCVVLVHLRHVLLRMATFRAVVVVPTLALSHQWYDRLVKSLCPYVPDVLIHRLDCESARTADDIIKAARAVVVAVVNSAPLLPDNTFDVIIVDEAHDMVADAGALNEEDSDDSSAMDQDHDSASGNVDDVDDVDNVDDSENGRQWLLRHIYSVPTLLVSATPPRNYNVVFRYDRAQAIHDGHVCDYRVYQPLLAPTDQHDPAAWLDPTFQARAEFLATAAERRGLRAMIVYINRAADIQLFSGAIRAALMKHGRAVWISSITAGTVERREILQRFEQGNPSDPTELRVLLAIRILDQGVDVVACDSVFVACPPAVLHDQSWRRLWQRMGRAMRLDPQNPTKVAHMLLWGDEARVERMVRLIADTDAELATRIGAMGIDYARRQPQAEQDAAQQLRVASVVGIVPVWTTDDKVALFCTHAVACAPVQKAIVTVDGLPWKIGFWWCSVQPNFSGGCTPNVRLSNAQMQRMRLACAWIDDNVAKLVSKRANRGFIPSSTDEAVELFCIHAAIGKPAKGAIVQINGLLWKIGAWWSSVQPNFSGGRKLSVRLSEAQMQRMRLACAWIEDNVANVVSRRANQGFIPSSTDEAVELFCIHAAIGKPAKGAIVEINGLVWKIGAWWNSVQPNFSGGRTLNIRLSEAQMQRMRLACAWIDDNVANVVSKRANQGFIPSSTNEAVELFCIHAANGKPACKAIVEINGLPWKIGQWWTNVQPNFAGSRKLHTKLTDQQRQHMCLKCGWIARITSPNNDS